MMPGTSFGGGNAQPTQNVSPFPQPPEYALNYTTDNIKNQRTLKPPPVPKKFSVFGEEIDMEGKMMQSLPEIGLQQLYSSNANWKSELKKLNKSVVAAFLDLLEVLIKCPDNPERREKIETIRMLFINMHHLVNEYRPVQARDTLRQMMVKQNKEIKLVTEKMRDYIATSNEAFDRVLKAFKEVEYDPSLPTAPKSYTEPPEFEKLSFKSKENSRLTNKGAIKHEFISQKYVMQKHLQLLQLADGEEKYSESFSKIDLEEEQPSSKSPRPKNEDEELEEAVEFELEEPGEFENKSSSSEQEEEKASENELDAQVEFMDDEESDMDALDESNSNPSLPQNKSIPTSPENSAPVEYQEPPTEFVDDNSQTGKVPENLEETSQQNRSHTPSPTNFLGQPDDILE
ncbi:Mediator of RNA polymerase II transcription subunit 7 [Aphelenchoides bicaudatus]|nr:Mediator of RNA polymerase II transcription subunit 7 [Aphelenchoides bicaudatus]